MPALLTQVDLVVHRRLDGHARDRGTTARYFAKRQHMIDQRAHS